MINVLVFPCGSEIGLEVNSALKYDKHINLFGLSSVPCHGEYVYEHYIEGISFINSGTFLDELNEIIEKYDIDVLIPAYDDVILYLSENRDSVKCRIVTSAAETCRIARSKIRTYDALEGCGFVPKTYSVDEIKEEDLPLFAKPDIGQGSQGAFRVDTMEDLEEVRSSDSRYVICELLAGKEYTIDCFTDASGELISISMRSRNRMRNGISVNTSAVPLPDEVREIAETINRKIPFDGVWFFQLKKEKEPDGKFKLLEVAPRVAGSMSLSRVRGFNYILNAVYQAMGFKVKGIPLQVENVEEDRALSNDFRLDIQYDTVYVDLDDTILLKDKINTEVMAFLYKCLNEKVKIILLSRHATDERETLRIYHISESMFYDIIHVDDDQLKSSFITEKNAIFIDDSFRERYDVAVNSHIHVFDLDCVRALTNNLR